MNHLFQALADAPTHKQDLVMGRYELPAPPLGTTVALKVIDMPGEERVILLKPSRHLLLIK